MNWLLFNESQIVKFTKNIFGLMVNSDDNSISDNTNMLYLTIKKRSCH